MKKLIGLFLLSFIFFLTAKADVPPVKHKKLKCLHTSLENKLKPLKEDYLYIIFKSNTASLVQLVPNNATYISESLFAVSMDLKRIFLNDFSGIGLNEWHLNRITGELSETYLIASKWERRVYGDCIPVKNDFNPITYLKSLADKNLKKEKEKINF